MPFMYIRDYRWESYRDWASARELEDETIREKGAGGGGKWENNQGINEIQSIRDHEGSKQSTS